MTAGKTMIDYTITAFVHMHRHYDSKGNETWVPEVMPFEMTSSYRAFVHTQQVTVQIPSDWTPVPQQIAAIEKEEKALTDDYILKIQRIQERKNKLLALTLSPTSGVVE